MKAKNFLSLIAVALIGGLIAVFAYTKFVPQEKKIITTRVETPVELAGISNGDLAGINLVPAASSSVEAVVHVKTKSMRQSYNPILEYFYGDRYRESQPVEGVGSGVIISDDGYIVTNNHVIDKSEEILITLNDKREFEAQLIGKDPSTDLALLKIDADNVHFIQWGNSDELQVGEWVLAVGNPFNLASTVTAGIVSAKGKNIGIIQGEYSMESFIQTDAAVNRGNSGGALVNVKGELVGINTAIISPSGGYAGISFAVPVAIVEKVVKDLIEYGAVQRAILGVKIQDVNSELAKAEDLDQIEGVFVAEVTPNGAARKAGIEAGDVILSINNVNVNSSGELQEQVSKYRPNDIVQVIIKRKNKTKQFDVTLRNLQGNTKVVSVGGYDKVLGARFEEPTKEELTKLGIKGGIKVVELQTGKLRTEGVQEGFVITQVNNQPVRTTDDLKRIIENTNGGVFIAGVYPDGKVAYYAFGIKKE